jgi:two-component system NtrC family sensor kinase
LLEEFSARGKDEPFEMSKLLIRLGLRFAHPADEHAFVARFTQRDVWRTQAAMLLGALIYCAFGIWDWILDPLAWTTTLAIRFAVAGFVLLPLTGLLGRRSAQHWAETIHLVYCVVPGCVLSIIYLLLEPSFDQAAAGLIIVILFVSTLLPLRLTSLAIFCVVTWACFVLCEAFAVHERVGMRFVNNFEIGIAYTLSLYAVGAREYEARHRFRTNQALRREMDRSERMLADLRDAQAHLVQAEKLASLGQLVAGVAHEINTPLGLALTTSTTMEGDLQQLGHTIASGQVRRSELDRGIARVNAGLRLVFANLTRAVDLVHSFKQVAIDQTIEEQRSFELQSWLSELVSTLEPLVRRKGHRLQVQCAEGIILDSYPGALAQVVSNLILNAIVHGFPEGCSGHLGLAVSRSAKGEVSLVFSDDGVGIPAEDLSRVFDPFFTTRRAQGSTGLGLHIVFNLVAGSLQGQIEVSSTVGCGTTFTVILPSRLLQPGSRKV